MRAPDRSNRSHLAPRPRPLVGRSGKPAARSIPAREGGATHRQQEAALQPFHLDCWPPESQRKTDPGQLTFIAVLSCSFLRNHKKLRFSSKVGWNSGCGGHKRQSWLRVTPPLPPYRPLFNGSSSKPNGSELFSNWFGHLRNRSIKELSWITKVSILAKSQHIISCPMSSPESRVIRGCHVLAIISNFRYTPCPQSLEYF